MQIARPGPAVSHIARAYHDRIEVRGRDLADELMGRLSFTEYFHLLPPGQEKVEVLREAQPPHQLVRQTSPAHLDTVVIRPGDVADGGARPSDLHAPPAVDRPAGARRSPTPGSRAEAPARGRARRTRSRA